MQVIYEDNHLIIVNKDCGELVQGDITGDEPLVETLKKWIKVKYNKPEQLLSVVNGAFSSRPLVAPPENMG